MQTLADSLSFREQALWRGDRPVRALIEPGGPEVILQFYTSLPIPGHTHSPTPTPRTQALQLLTSISQYHYPEVKAC